MTDWPADVDGEELKRLAVAFHKEQVFTTLHLGEEMAMLGSVFLPIGLGCLAGKTKEEFQRLGLVYEYLSEAGSRSVNGYPIFMSARYLNRKQTEETMDKVAELFAAEEKVMNG